MLLPSKGTTHNRWIYPLTLFILGVLGIIGSVYVALAVHRSNEIHLVDRASTLARAINPSEVSVLQGSESDLESPSYQHVKELLTSIRSVNHDIRFIYLNGLRSDGSMFFFVDSEDPDSEDYSPPGQPYQEATPIMYDLFVSKQTGFEISSDRWGGWVSAYAPLIDVEGNVIALVGMDIPSRSYITDLIVYSSLPIVFVFIVILLISIAQYIRIKERRYIDQKAEFLSITSHEIRTPLTGIRWAAENLLSQKEIHENMYAKNVITTVYDNCVALINRINNLLSVTAFEAGKKVTIRSIDIKLLSVVKEVFESMKLAATSREVAIIIDPSLTDSVNIVGDPEQIRQVFVNIISNAIKYTKPETKVTISYRKGTSEHIIDISDGGDGMTKEEASHIFDGYHRTDAAKRSQQYGTGLGLYLVKKVMELHGGNIAVTSTPGVGTTFTLVFRK